MRKTILAAALVAFTLSSHVTTANAGYWDYVKCNFGRWTDIQRGLQGKFGAYAGGWYGDALLASPFTAFVAVGCMI